MHPQSSGIEVVPTLTLGGLWSVVLWFMVRWLIGFLDLFDAASSPVSIGLMCNRRCGRSQYALLVERASQPAACSEIPPGRQLELQSSTENQLLLP